VSVGLVTRRRLATAADESIKSIFRANGWSREAKLGREQLKFAERVKAHTKGKGRSSTWSTK
jgi:hypothetical protein